jgi:hypothetical protein
MKLQGNEAFKKGNFQEAVEHYTSAIKADPSDHVLPCNRAFARMKLKQYVFFFFFLSSSFSDATYKIRDQVVAHDLI